MLFKKYFGGNWKYLHGLAIFIAIASEYWPNFMSHAEPVSSVGRVLNVCTYLIAYLFIFIFVRTFLLIFNSIIISIFQPLIGPMNALLDLIGLAYRKTAKALNIPVAGADEYQTYYGMRYTELTRKQLQKRFFASGPLHRETTFDLGEVYVGKPELNESGAPRVTGAFVKLNGHQFSKNEQHLHDEVKRNNARRRSAEVPGFEAANAKKIKKGNQWFSLYHRTHLLPFRFGLSEGDDIPYLLFTGTAHLNRGDRPDQDYFVPDNGSPDSFIDRQNYLKDLLDQIPVTKKLKPSTILIGDINVPAPAPFDTNFSLDDFERLATAFIVEIPEDMFKYGVFCHYDDDNAVIPSAVSVYLIDVSQKLMAFSVTLPNEL